MVTCYYYFVSLDGFLDFSPTNALLREFVDFTADRSFSTFQIALLIFRLRLLFFLYLVYFISIIELKISNTI